MAQLPPRYADFSIGDLADVVDRTNNGSAAGGG